MSEPTSSLPPWLHATIANDLRPVRPIASPERRAIWLGALGLASVLFAVASAHSSGTPSALGLVVAGAQWAVGLAMVWAAMREAVPGRSPGRAGALGLLGAGLSTQLAAAALLATSAGDSWLGSGGYVAGAACAAGESAFGLPVGAAATWLLLRAFPLRARLAGALAGAAAGLFADAGWHLICPRADLAHVLVWHVGSTLVLAGAGYLAGIGIERRTVGGPNVRR